LTDSPLEALANSSFSRVADARPFDGNAVRLLCDGPENYPVWLAAIASAKRTVYIENYIFADDETGRTFADALIDAARRGVRCRVIYDWLGCRSRAPGRFWRRLTAAGVEVRCYNPPQIINPLVLGSRDHRKVLVVDSEVGFTGGLCIGGDWAGNAQRGIVPWRDTAVEVRGPAAAYLSIAFADSWATTGAPIPVEDLPNPQEMPKAGSANLWVIAGKPDSMGLYRLEQLVAEIVQNSLWLADAYFVATTGYVRALAGAAQAGIDVRLLVPSSSDMRMVQAISRSAYRPLLECGVRVFEWNGPMMHAKTAVADGMWSRVGSSNSNFASWVTNRELDVTIHDTAFAAEMENMFERDLEHSTEVVLDAGRVRPIKRRMRSSRSRRWYPRPGSAGRLLAGAVGVGSAVGASIARHRLLGAAESRIMAPAGLVLLTLALFAFFAPSIIAYPIGLIAAWIAVTLLMRAWRFYETAKAEQQAKGPKT
jgi:cardiolipin synthase